MLHRSTTRVLLWLLVALLLLVVVALYFELSFPTRVQPAPQTGAMTSHGFPQSAPAPKPADYVTAQKGFQYLVQYTSSGFRPASLTMKKGETIRFTNTSADQVTLSVGSTSSGTLARMQYWEYTAAKAGTFAVQSSAGRSLSVTVQ
jgi:plastocyanin